MDKYKILTSAVIDNFVFRENEVREVSDYEIHLAKKYNIKIEKVENDKLQKSGISDKK